jgi:hypothetical protein
MVVTVRRAYLGRFLGGEIGNEIIGARVATEDLAPQSIISHPASSEEAVVVFRPLRLMDSHVKVARRSES